MGEETGILVAGNNFSPSDLSEVMATMLLFFDDHCDGDHHNDDDRDDQEGFHGVISKVYNIEQDSWTWTSYMQV